MSLPEDCYHKVPSQLYQIVCERNESHQYDKYSKWLVSVAYVERDIPLVYLWRAFWDTFLFTYCGNTSIATRQYAYYNHKPQTSFRPDVTLRLEYTTSTTQGLIALAKNQCTRSKPLLSELLYCLSLTSRLVAPSSLKQLAHSSSLLNGLSCQEDRECKDWTILFCSCNTLEAVQVHSMKKRSKMSLHRNVSHSMQCHRKSYKVWLYRSWCHHDS